MKIFQFERLVLNGVLFAWFELLQLWIIERETDDRFKQRLDKINLCLLWCRMWNRSETDIVRKTRSTW
ncbi:hypothetical protein VCR4J5_780067 [Vibrio crassostreae]|uniref:DUF1127 domain-containing protein n=1 Tax=Vibrio crassostreae TaxID=246167 RepID=A0ABP1X395_9VIBR|nr:DUF645 domain-containing protein [Vibrio crassostreae]CAK2359795.1 DUF645 domain-containing protein [Vibrio crassostreae]CDT35928.1 hypothetical protein VCR19J5_230434 [Vibrio crassostreae]CDT66616.1 hypothetical protein VCR4J5_780067 [Vibrio crassostreae]